MAEPIRAYNVKTKEKNVEMKDAVITKTARGGYMAQGNDGKGNKLTCLMGAEKPSRRSKTVWLNSHSKSTIKSFLPARVL